jgi:hypothetical protein
MMVWLREIVTLRMTRVALMSWDPVVVSTSAPTQAGPFGTETAVPLA